MNKKVIAGVGLVVILGAGGWWYTSRQTSATDRSAVQYVQEQVRRGTVRAQVSGSGAVRSVNGVTVTPAQTGTVMQILAKEGDKVQVGQPILVLENKTLLASLVQAQFDVQSARTNLNNLTSPQATAVRAQELKVENARVTLQQRKDDVANLQLFSPTAGVIASVSVVDGQAVGAGTLAFTIYDDLTPTLIIQLPQETASALANGQKASVTLAGFGTVEGVVARLGGTASPVSGNRDANLPVAIDLPPLSGIRPGMVGQVNIAVPGLTYRVQGNGSVENDAEEVRIKVAGTVADLAVAEGERVAQEELLLTLENEALLVQLSQAENDLESQSQSLANLVDPTQDPSGQLASLTQKLQQAQATLALRESDVADLTVKAPVAGTLSALTPVVGDKVSGSTALFRVADYSSMQVTIAVDELDVARIKVGQPAEITLDALPGQTYKGRVTKVNPEGTFRNDIATFEVTVTVENSEGLMSGMNANINITVEEKSNTLYVPVAAVRIMQGRATVQVLENNQVVQKEIKTGVRTNDRYEVVSGLNEGEQVITAIVRPQSGLPMGGGGPFGGGGGQGGQTRQGGGTGTNPGTGGAGGNRP